jgi:hypothetical protein
MSNPWLKFYPSDWRSDPALRMCSIAARGLWMEMLCVMHENGGDLEINSKALTPRQLANLAGCGVDEVDTLLSELEDAGVFSRREDGTIYSRRMIRDAEKAEADKANGRKGGNPKIKGGVNPPDKGEDKAQKPEARSQIPEQTPPPTPKGEGAGDLFEVVEKVFPRSPHYKPERAEKAFGRLSAADQHSLLSKAKSFYGWWKAEQVKRSRAYVDSLAFAPPLDKWISDGSWRSFEAAPASSQPSPDLVVLQQDDPLIPAIERIRGKSIIFGTRGTATVTKTEVEQAKAQALERGAA